MERMMGREECRQMGEGGGVGWGWGGHACAGVSVSVSDRVCVIDLAVFVIARGERRGAGVRRLERRERREEHRPGPPPLPLRPRPPPLPLHFTLLTSLSRPCSRPASPEALTHAAGSRRATPPPPLLLRPLRAKGEPSACSALSRALPLAHYLSGRRRFFSFAHTPALHTAHHAPAQAP